MTSARNSRSPPQDLALRMPFANCRGFYAKGCDGRARCYLAVDLGSHGTAICLPLRERVALHRHGRSEAGQCLLVCDRHTELARSSTADMICINATPLGVPPYGRIVHGLGPGGLARWRNTKRKKEKAAEATTRPVRSAARNSRKSSPSFRSSLPGCRPGSEPRGNVSSWSSKAGTRRARAASSAGSPLARARGSTGTWHCPRPPTARKPKLHAALFHALPGGRRDHPL